VRDGLLIDQHFLKRGRIGRLLPALHALGCPLGLGVDENAAVIIQGGQIEVIGGSGALLVDIGTATHDPALPAFNLRGAQLTYLDSGDRHDLDSGRTTPSPAKLAGRRIDLGDPGFQPTATAGRYFLDILGDGCLLAALTQLLDGADPEVFGLAYRAKPTPQDTMPDVGFEFRLHRGPGFVGWREASAGAGACTLLDARLDVVPVRVAIPLYAPLAAGPRRVVESAATPSGELP